jgi:hypothetical protein
MGSPEAVILHQSRKQVSVLPNNPVIVIGGAELITQYNKKLDREIKVYNRRLEKLSSPYFIRTKHSVGSHEYPGRYFYKHVWDEDAGRMREVYVGLTVPEGNGIPSGGFPPPPTNLLEGFVYRVIYHVMICSKEMYDKFFRFFEGRDVMVLKLKI